jgi:hypothetical protein
MARSWRIAAVCCVALVLLAGAAEAKKKKSTAEEVTHKARRCDATQAPEKDPNGQRERELREARSAHTAVTRCARRRRATQVFFDVEIGGEPAGAWRQRATAYRGVFACIPVR